MSESKKSLSRREFLKWSSVVSAGAALAACAPVPAGDTGGDTAASSSDGAMVERMATDEEVAQWLTGKVPADQAGDFKIMSWEDEGEIRKFLLHINQFFDTFYPGMEPEIEWGIPWGEYWTKLPTLMAAGTPPDMAWQHQSRGEVFPSKGWSTDLTDYINTWAPDGWPDDWWEQSVDTMSYNGVVYAIPYDWATHGLYINRDIMDSILDYPAQSDWTWQDFREAAIAATTETDDGKQFGVKLSTAASFLNLITQSNGGELFAEDLSESFFGSDTAVDAAQFVYDLRWTDGVMATPEEENAMGMTGNLGFVSGRIAMNRSLNDEAFRLDEAIGDGFPWGVYSIPAGTDAHLSFAGNSGWFIPTGSRYPDMAYELIRFGLSNPELLPTTGVMGSMIVARKSFWEWGLPQGELAERIPNYKEVFVDIPAKDPRTFPNWPGSAEWQNLYRKHMDPVFLEGNPDVAGAMAALQEETNEFLASENGG
ncbi:MAG: extracellular solute-binding protein [Chloroflexota bacterium]